MTTAQCHSQPLNVNDSDSVLNSVRNYYGNTLKSSKDLKTSAHSNGTTGSLFDAVPKPVMERFYGCGQPADGASVPPGSTVLDLGSGSGRDCYLMAAMVGSQGKVVGVDMTTEQLQVAREHADTYCRKQLGYDHCNMEFLEGYIEALDRAGVKPASIDIAISNCVINLSPNKEAVLKQVYQALKPGGEFFFSDVYADRRMPPHVLNHEVLWGECLAGALYQNDFETLCRNVGFTDPRVVETRPMSITNAELRHVTGNIKFNSITYRLFKIESLEIHREDYGQVAVYLGTIPEHEHLYIFDNDLTFETGRPVMVCGNTASMLTESVTLKDHFRVIGDRAVHFGAFNRRRTSDGNTATASISQSTSGSTSRSCGSSCASSSKSGCCG